MIPKIIHQFWDGPKQRPSELMDEWKSAYTSAGWRYLLWNSTDLLRLKESLDKRGLSGGIEQKREPLAVNYL